MRKQRLKRFGLTWSVLESVSNHEDQSQLGFRDIVGIIVPCQFSFCWDRNLCLQFYAVLDWSRYHLDY